MEEEVVGGDDTAAQQTMPEWVAAAAAHSLRRIGFGASQQEIEGALQAGREATVDELLARNACDPLLDKGLPSLLAGGEIQPLASWWIARILDGGAPFAERIALMWHNHFATSFAKVDDARLMHDQVQLFRDHGRGDFRELLRRVAKDPAMLLWLDGNENRLGNPNENFAREVFELFALGLGAYDEKDVQEAARAFTGWGVDRRRFVNRERYHDAGEKQVLGSRGKFDGDGMLDLILARPECPRWIARRLIVEFIHPRPRETEIETWAAVLVEEDWNIERTCRRLFLSSVFLSPRARLSRISGPVELVAGAARSMGARPAPKALARATADMGQNLYQPPSVQGWTGGRDWIHAGTWLARHNTLVQLAHNAVEQGLGWSADTLLAVLLPDGAPAPLRDAVELALRKRSRVAIADATALVLTSPEAQLA